MKNRFDKIRDVIAANAAKSGKKHEVGVSASSMGRLIKDHKCNTSTGIHGGLTFGSGELDFNGFWQFPCDKCARDYERKHPEDAECWPFKSKPIDNSVLESANRNLLDRIWGLELRLKSMVLRSKIEKISRRLYHD